jgi:plastocyanin
MRSRVLLAAAALLLVSACGDDPQPQVTAPTPTATSTTAAPTASPTPTLPAGIDQVVRFTVKGKRVEGPSRVKVSKGDTVRLVITSDKADEVHVHTFDNLVKVKAGSPANVDVKATIAGIFEVEMHSTGLLVTKLQVQ